MVSACFTSYLNSLSRVALQGLLELLQTLKAQLQIDRIRAIAKSLRLTNLLAASQSILNSLATDAFSELRGAVRTFGFSNFRGCPTVDSMSRLITDELTTKSSASTSATFAVLKNNRVKTEQDNETSKITSRISFLDQLIIDVQTRINEIGTEE